MASPMPATTPRLPWPDGFAELVARRAERVPLQHLTGRAAFRRLELRVGPGVFVPRPETELTAGLAVEAALAAEKTVILEIELQGARQVRRTLPEAQFVFIAPPSWEELVRRLELRGTETPEQVQRRLQTAHEELAAQDEFDHVVVNEEIGAAVEDLVGLMGL